VVYRLHKQHTKYKLKLEANALIGGKGCRGWDFKRRLLPFRIRSKNTTRCPFLAQQIVSYCLAWPECGISSEGEKPETQREIGFLMDPRQSATQGQLAMSIDCAFSMFIYTSFLPVEKITGQVNYPFPQYQEVPALRSVTQRDSTREL
jgi:hypothetical protein